MSEAADADLSEELILDPEPEEVDADAEGAEEGEEGADEAAARQAEAERAPLPAEELQRRYDNTRTALSEERSKRRELERRLEALESGGGRRPADEERGRGRAEPEEEIDPDVDPIGAMKQLRAKVAAYEAQDRLERENEEQRQRRESAIGRVEQRLQEHETDFREDHPDYDDAARHYAQARARELLGFGISEGNVKTMLREEFAVLAQRAMEARKNPAAVVYEMAKGRGYKRGGVAKEPAADKGGKAPTGAGAQTRLKDIARGARATSALQAGGGRSGSGADAETISRININSKAGRAQFEREFAKLEDEARRSRSGRR